MRMTRDEFLAWPHKAITLMGMSGTGKTTLANKLPKCRWFHYSGDYRIGTKYLQEPILDNIKKQAMQVGFLRDLLRSDSIYICSNITVHNLEPLSTFVGKIGDPVRGGLSVAEFKRRQRLHREAEIGAMRDVVDFLRKARDIYEYDHFVNDAGGSMCELEDPESIELLSEHTLILYLRADVEMEDELIRRAVNDPKPMYYSDAFLDAQLEEYLALEGLSGPETVDPDVFAQWMFPRLVRWRRPLYEEIAGTHGYTVDARACEAVTDEADFLELVARALDGQGDRRAVG